MEKMKFNAETINLNEVLEFIDGKLEANDCPMKTQMQIDVAAEEIFVNVAHYAYHPEIGIVEVCVDFQKHDSNLLMQVQLVYYSHDSYHYD